MEERCVLQPCVFLFINYNFPVQRMKKLLLSLFALLLTAPVMAQTIAKGYYRVQNFSSKRYIFLVDDKTTGISQIDNGKSAIENYYDLQGRRVDRPTKGLYIVNGKKVIIK